ncbi:hypothetical protein LWI29_000262 [Acer saccharum]|uniref:Berberine/berberine-like domain-containing protein n=1 Tax=Acer saccharum TaxID=4024 RepID=A0AA39VF66_ACESA|nr:hypothetical protein LWI29_000262 [Acer saccharum]
MVDPNNFFRNEQSIPTLPTADSVSGVTSTTTSTWKLIGRACYIYIESFRLFRKDPTIIWSPVGGNKVALTLAEEALKLVEDNFWIEDFPQNVREEVETNMLI